MNVNIRALLAEALGTFILVGFGSMAVVSAAIVGSGQPLIVLLVAPFGFGLALMAAIVFVGHVSGGHFNPAVTLAYLFDGRIDVVNAIGYAIAQVVGAVVASLMILLLVAKEAVTATVNGPGVPEGQAFAAEAILTAAFVGVILTITKKQPTHAAFVIPLVLVMIHFAAVPISGASVNPARSLGPAIVSGTYKSLWLYLTAPFLGAIIGWGLYRFFTPPDDEVSVEVDTDVDDVDDLEDVGELDELPAL
jgi:MIP family channel proteins